MILPLVAAALAFVTAQASDDQVGSPSTVKARQSIHAFGQCIAIDRPRDVRALLATDFRDRTYGVQLRELLRRPAGCRGVPVSRGMHAAGTLVWGGALAEGILRRDAILPKLAAATAHDPARPNIEARNAGELMAVCVVRANPAGTVALLETQPGTAEEQDAIARLGSTLGSCVPLNSQSRFTRDSLRALIALGALRLAQHNGVAVK